MELRCRDRAVPLADVAVMGVLNVTPDSFSDGGLWLDPDAATKHGLAMIAEGAAIVDVGGESTRPDAEPVEEAEELRRVIPVIEALAAETEVPISIDTRKAEVARVALRAGASIINDTAGEAGDRGMDRLAAESGAGIVIMHSRGTPATMRTLTNYSDVVSDVRSFLERRAGELIDAGVEPEGIALDPGIGFAKTPAQNLLLLRHLDRVADLPHPILVGTSRKSFIGATLDLPESERLEGTISTCVVATLRGARILRVHDVRPVIRAVRMTEAIERAR